MQIRKTRCVIIGSTSVSCSFDRNGPMPFRTPGLTHEWIWQAIDALATRHGLTASGLARLANLDPTTFNKSKRFTPDGRPRWPSTESISKILVATGTSLDEFVELATIGNIAPGRPAQTMELGTVPIVGEIREATVTQLAPDIDAGAEEHRLSRSPQAPFALAVADASLEPVYSRGNTLFLNPRQIARAGDRVVVKAKGMMPLPRLLVRQGPAQIELAPFGPDYRRLRLRHGSIQWIARIMWARQ